MTAFNVRIHYGVIVLVALIGGAAIQIWGPPEALVEYKGYAIAIMAFLGGERILTKGKEST